MGAAPLVFSTIPIMNVNQEHLAFNHLIGLALSQWQANIEFGLYAVASACSGTAPPADTYLTFFTEISFRKRLQQVHDLVLATVQDASIRAQWQAIHSRIETAAKGRNALAHHWVLNFPSGKPGRTCCLLSRTTKASKRSPDRPPPGALCVRDISQLHYRFSAVGVALRNLAARIRGQKEPYAKEWERERPPQTLAQLTHEIRVLAGCP
jgi:hypothetical protein